MLTRDGCSVCNGPNKNKLQAKQEAIRAAVKWSWDGYKRFAWGSDTLVFCGADTDEATPTGLNQISSAAATLVDSLDVLLLMDFPEEFAEAKAHVETQLVFDADAFVSTFEYTIRVLGGLLSTFALSTDGVFLRKAIELGDSLMPAFTAGELPCRMMNLRHGICMSGSAGGGEFQQIDDLRATSLAEAGTVQMEFRELSRASGDPKYERAATAALRLILRQAAASPIQFLLPENLYILDAKPKSGDIQVDGGADSYYECKILDTAFTRDPHVQPIRVGFFLCFFDEALAPLP